MLDRLYLIDRSQALVDAWSQVFEGFDEVLVRHGDFFLQPADAMLSPANSFGIMDGGLDLAIRNELGFDVETAVQRAIIDRFYGEMPVGSATIVETGHDRWPYLVAAPTMRVPEAVPHTLNAYLSFRAALVAIVTFNQDTKRIRSLVVPGLATGIGGMAPRRCAGQMRAAWKQLQGRPRIPSYDTIHRVHDALRRAE